jgi:UDP-GlcNAc:undecaprenyl-phosphate GlcNAc-1-phosphate transferase
MNQDSILLVFALAFMGCILATPTVVRIASWAGAIDRPDSYRRVHKGAIPRMGGLSLAAGLLVATIPVITRNTMVDFSGFMEWFVRSWSIPTAGAVIVGIGLVDDARGMSPRTKLLGQALAVMVLIAGGIQITKVTILGLPIHLSTPLPLTVAGWSFTVDPLSTFVTLVWFLGCMNIWNLIDGMDGLASGVGLLVSATLMLVALRQGNANSAALAAGLAGSLAGFLVYNWHPACIFLGDTGSLLIGLLIGVIGVESSMKGTATVSILFPILAMGLPISDTAMAIFRRWVRNLPLSSADRRHMHHLLIGLGLNPRQAALLLYIFSAFLCGVVLLGVAQNNQVHGEFLALILGISGCLAFLIILTSRRDELKSLSRDLHDRFVRKNQERVAAKYTWETIQKVELANTEERVWELLAEAASKLGCDELRLRAQRPLTGEVVFDRATQGLQSSRVEIPEDASGAAALYRLKTEYNLRLEVLAHHRETCEEAENSSEVQPDIAFRAVQHMVLAAAGRLDFLMKGTVGESVDPDTPSDDIASEEGLPPAPIAPARSVRNGIADLSPNLGTSAVADLGSLRWTHWMPSWNGGGPHGPTRS